MRPLVVAGIFVYSVTALIGVVYTVVALLGWTGGRGNLAIGGALSILLGPVYFWLLRWRGTGLSPRRVG